MKNTRTILYAMTIILLSTSFLACDKGSDDDNDPMSPGGVKGTTCDNCFFTATVAEATVSSYSATTAKAVWTKQSAGGGSSRYTFYVAGEDKTNKRMLHFFLYESAEHLPGTYHIRLSNGNQGIYIENYNASGEKSWLAPGPSTDMEKSFGTVTLSEITATRAKGTFSFTVYENVTYSTTKTLTSGSFDVPLTKQGF